MLFDCLSSTTSLTSPRRWPALSLTVVPMTLDARIADVCPVLVVMIFLLVEMMTMESRHARFQIATASRFARHACRLCQHTSPICVDYGNERCAWPLWWSTRQ